MDKKPRLIDADALLEDLKQSHDLLLNIYEGLQFLDEKRVCSAEIATFNEIGLRIKAAPTIEAEPVRHGRWVVDDLGRTHCSMCGKRLPFFHCYSDEPCSDYDEEWDEEIPQTRFCPNCGAKMDGGK